MSDQDKTTNLDAAQTKIDALTTALNDAIVEAESGGILRATVVTSWGGAGSQSVRVEIRERSKFELELLGRRTATDE